MEVEFKHSLPRNLPVQMPAMPSGHIVAVGAVGTASASVARSLPPGVGELEEPPSEGPGTLAHADMWALRHPGTTTRRKRC